MLPAIFARVALVAALLQFASGVNLVEVYVTVTDPAGHPVTNLTRDDFSVFEDGTRQSISTFTMGDFPLALAVALDRSFSMQAGGRLDRSKAAVGSFVQTLRGEDRMMLLAIGSGVDEAAPLSSDRAAFVAALDRLDAWGTTSLHDAIVEGIDRIQPERGRRALVIVSDGSDRYSRTSASDTVAKARASDVLLYPIAIGRTRPPLFAELAVVTGGRSAHVKDIKDGRPLAGVLSSIASELRSQYLIGYSPSTPISPGEHRWRTIRVTVSRPDVRVRARDGYLAK